MRTQPVGVLDTSRHIPVQRIVGARLIGDDVDAHAAAHELGHHVGSVGDERDAARCPITKRALRDGERVVERRRDLVQETLPSTALRT